MLHDVSFRAGRVAETLIIASSQRCPREALPETKTIVKRYNVGVG